MKRSYYYLYYTSNAGGGFAEFDFTTAKLENLKAFVTNMFFNNAKAETCHLLLGYGLQLYLTVVENGELCKEEDILAHMHIKAERWGNGEFSYDSDSWLFETEWGDNEQAKFDEWLIDEVMSNDTEVASKACQTINLTINWEQMNIPELKENLLQPTEEITAENIFGTEEPIRLGSVWLNLSEEDMLKSFK